MQASLAVRGTASRAASALVVLVSLVVLFAPADDVPAAPPGVDKGVHLLLFAALAVTGRWAGARPLPLAVGLVVYAAGSEVLQAVTPLARSGSPADLLADVLGVVLGLAVWVLGARLRPDAPAGSLGR
jgi:hypothetical protein